MRGSHMSKVCVELGGIYEGGAGHRIIVETMEVLRREYEAKSNGCRVGTKHRIQNPKSKHDTEGGRATAKLPWKFLELGPAYY